MINKYILGFSVIFVTCVEIVNLLKTTTFDVIKVHCEGHPEWATNITCGLKSYNRTYRTVSYEVRYGGTTICQVNVAYFNIRIDRKPLLSPGANLKIIDETIDGCKFLRTGHLGPVSAIVYAAIKNPLHIPKECPVPPFEHVGITNCEYNGQAQRHIPSFVVNGRYRLRFQFITENITIFTGSLEALARVDGILDGS